MTAGVPITSLAALALLASAPPPSAEVRAVNAIVAVVDGAPITSIEVRARAAPFLEQIRRSKQPDWQKAQAERGAIEKALDAILDDKLFDAAAKDYKISVGPKVVDVMIDRAAVDLHLSRADYLDRVWVDHGFKPDDLRAYFRSDVVARYVLSHAWTLRSRAPEPTDDKAKEAFRSAWLAERRKLACIERRP